jgi:hypothetical protein
MSEETAVLMIGSPLMRQPKLFAAAAARIAELAERSAIVVVCPTPIVLAARLARAGHRAVVVSAKGGEADFLSGIARLGGIPVLDGSQRDAIEIADALGARAILYTDSRGAMPVRHASHVEVMELAEQRAAAVSGDAAHEASRHGITYEIRNVVDDSATTVRGYGSDSSPVTSITVASGYALLSIASRPAEAATWKSTLLRILERIASAGISIELLQSFGFGLRCIATANHLSLMRTIAQEFGLAFGSIERCTKLCIVGTGVSSTAGVFYRGFSALAKENIPLLHWADSNVTLSFVVNDDFARRSEIALHAALAPGADVSVSAAISFDADLGLVRINGRERKLGARQAQLLRYLLDNLGRILPVEELARTLFGADGKEEIAAVRVHLHNLRKKIEDNPDSPRYIVTIPDQGYVFVR